MSEYHKRESGGPESAISGNEAPILIYSTFPTPQEAEHVGGSLVDKGLAACVNIIPGMTSIYVWQDRRHRDDECVMIIKTRASLAEAVVDAVKRTHSYTNPALLVLATQGGSNEFCRWIEARTAAPRLDD